MKLLEIGFLHGRTFRCWRHDAEGVDIDEASVNAMRAEGRTVYRFNVEDAFPLEPESYDAVYCNNVFEHLVAPHLFLVRVHRILKPSGLLALGVPVVPPAPLRWIYPLLGYKGWSAQAHINFFTAKTLRLTVERGGFKVLKNYFPFISRLPLAPLGVQCLIVARRIDGFKYPHKQLPEYDPSWAGDRRHFR